MGHKALETTHNINKEFGLGTTNECTEQWCFKKFWKGDKSLEDEECNYWPSEVDSDQLGESMKLILLQLHKRLPKNSVLTAYDHSAFDTNWKVRKLGASGANHGKNCHFRVIFSNSMQQQWTISESDCDIQWKVGFIGQPVTTSSVAEMRTSSKAFSKAKLAWKKRSWSLFGGLLLIWFTVAFWILGKTLQRRSMLRR